jgi:hypothetical protein
MLKQLVCALLALSIAAPSAVCLAGWDSNFLPYDVSLPKLSLKPDECVISYKCRVKSGAILRVSTPYLWEVDINNGDMSRQEVTANNYVGNYAIGTDRSDYFDRFLVVGKPRKALPKDYGPLSVECTISIGTWDDFDNPRIVTLSMKDLKVEPAKVGR